MDKPVRDLAKIPSDGAVVTIAHGKRSIPGIKRADVSRGDRILSPPWSVVCSFYDGFMPDVYIHTVAFLHIPLTE